eukprot:TRINITY_DN1368_c0_g1_i1.p1 TRINITY_DN1368_c0_g1~~TRINITY_DN1368_c0_g1_i1.p1  ORF type:complete len:1037 (-),score=291.27 TRINITY_DN1368_c0_g1_i1:67-3177(-)
MLSKMSVGTAAAAARRSARLAPALANVNGRMELALMRAALAAAARGKSTVASTTTSSASSDTFMATSETKSAPGVSAEKLGELLKPTDLFAPRHLGPSAEEVKKMCEMIGVKDLEELMQQAMPPKIRGNGELKSYPDGDKLGEAGALALAKAMMSKNVVATNFLGMGYHGTHVPSAILRNLLENPGWYTPYTPYQAEASQGRLESIYNYQTLVAELTGMEVANASLLDEGTAAAEAMSMIMRAINNKTKNQFFVSSNVHPQSIAILQTRAKYLNMELVIGDHKSADFGGMKNLCGALLQYPGTDGVVEDFQDVADALHKNGAMLCVAADPLSLCLLKPPVEFGADVAVGSMQRFGVPMWFGGPSAAYLACSKKHVRRMPGRLIGKSIDRLGNEAFRLTLQTREQHIRLDRATSNLCTTQALLANMSAMYAIYHKSDGLKHIARRVHTLAQLFASRITALGASVASPTSFFDTVAFDVPADKSPTAVAEALEAQRLNVRVLDASRLAVSFDATHEETDVDALVAALAEAVDFGGAAGGTSDDLIVNGQVPDVFARTKPFLQQKIFNSINSETELMRYMFQLQLKDLSLDRSMISLGSCTMKLNSVSSLMPCSWPEVANMHPFAPESNTAGYREMLDSLEKYLIDVTGFDACSLQPTSGASGEYAGLLVIREYLASIGQGHRNLCIIPKSAHGTNPASAAMCDMEIKWIDDSKGINITEFKELCEANKDRLCAIMVTYPSTRAFFEDNIIEMCQIVHDNGGQVYMDGANMNAQLGLTSPAIIGADVCHLNLHKTFSIPHGGGGPGMGPICVKAHLTPHLPGHNIVPPPNAGTLGAVSAAPWGQAGIALIPWMFCTMLGRQGLTDSARYAILNANYMKARLAPHFNVYASNSNDRCAHEFIIDCTNLKKNSGVVEEDIAKRLQDYGFHAPTMSWPVPHSLMVEPTESEDKSQLDRFCDAMISIREEIRKIEQGVWPKDDNPLKMAPHTEGEVCGNEWTHAYSREEAAFPVDYLRKNKYWPTAARVDNSLGDRKLILRYE